jgi:hypothetical protein
MFYVITGYALFGGAGAKASPHGSGKTVGNRAECVGSLENGELCG